MQVAERHEVRPLLQARTEDGHQWMFGFLPDARWMITRNGERFFLGAREKTSVNRGVKKFLSLTCAIADSDAKCDPAVGALLDRIEGGAPAAAKVVKSHGRVRPHAPKGSSAYWLA